MTKAEAIRWIKREIAREIRSRISEPPERINEAPDPILVQGLWTDQTWLAADKIWPEDKQLHPKS
jgi:hypothetical protein